MNTDPYVPPPVVDHPKQNKLAALFAALMQPRNQVRAKMARESRRRNRVR